MTDKFKVGDRVRFVEDCDIFRKGDIVEVTRCDGDNVPRGKREGDDRAAFFSDHRAELVDVFTVGQRVRIIGYRGISHSFNKGDTGTVIEIVWTERPRVKRDGDGTVQWVSPEDLEPITEATMTPKCDPLEVIKAKLAELPATYAERSSHQDIAHDLLTALLYEAWGLRPEVRTTTTVEFVQV